MRSDLGLTLGFTLEDLDANRAGFLSDAQRTRLRRTLLRDTLVYGLAALMPFGVLAVVLDNALNHRGICGGPVVLVVLILLVAAFPVYIVSLHRATRADLAAEVTAISGRVRLDALGRSRYRLSVGSQRLSISAEVYSAFVDGAFYRVYYTPNLRLLLSAEFAEDSSSAAP